jgi:hypothetical protein
MKKLAVLLMGVIILYLGSVIYRDRVTAMTARFPIERLEGTAKGESCFYLVLFFSMNNCLPCLQVVDFLNEPPDRVRVVGIVPDAELPRIEEVRQTTKARFPIFGLKKWRRYDPVYAPTLFGIGPDGNVYFILPCVGLEESYFYAYFSEFVRKAKYLFFAPGNR